MNMADWVYLFLVFGALLALAFFVGVTVGGGTKRRRGR